MPDLIQIDGSFGEGGGQILRTSLALSVVTGRGFRIFNVRAGRPKPGLRRQHMTAVLAAARISDAAVTGAVVNSTEVTFEPFGVRAGEYHFDVGSAGSTMLVLQTVLPPLMMADGPSTVVLAGGTHNVGAPPFPFLAKTFLPALRRMGPGVELEIERAGFAPRGGGRARVRITPAPLQRIELMERGAVRRRRVTATVAGLPREIAEREVRLVARLLELRADEVAIEELPGDQGPGNLVTVEVESAGAGTEMFTAFGQRGVRAEEVAREAARQAKQYLEHGAAVGEHLADQLLLPMALAGGGAFVTDEFSLHATTNVATIGKFLDMKFAVAEEGKFRRVVTVQG